MSVRLNNISIKCMLAILLAGLFASCKDEMDEYEGDRPSRLDALAIKFNAFDDGFQKPSTRAGVMEDFSAGDKVSVLSMMSPNGTSWSQVFATDAVEITNVGEYLWSYTNKQKWTDGNTYKFRGFYPSSSDGFNRTAGEECTTGYTHNAISGGSTTLTLTDYRAANDPRQNTDLMVSDVVERPYSKSTGNDDPVELKMNHLLANVNFQFKTKKGQMVNITSLKIKGYATEGNCTIGDEVEWDPKVTDAIKGGNGSTGDVYVNITKQNDGDFKVVYVKTGIPLVNINKGQLKKGEVEIIASDEFSAETEDFASASIGGSTIISGDHETNDPYIIDGYKNMLFIPQILRRPDEVVKVKFDGSIVTENRIPTEFIIKHLVYAEIEYYFGTSDPGKERRSVATVDLTANGKVPEWEPGKKYNYTIGIYEYQATANITIEDWTHHTYEEELK